jgi:hypothetical protein
VDNGSAAPQSTPVSPLAPARLRPIVAVKSAWNTFRAHVGISLGAMLILFLIILAGELIPFLNVLFIILALPALGAGGAYFLVRMVRGESPPIASLFDGFKRWPSATGAVLLQTLVMFAIMAPLIAAMIGVGAFGSLAHTDTPTMPPPAVIVPLVCAALVSYTGMFWWMTRTWPVAFVVMEPDNPGAMESLRRSWAMTRGNAWRAVGLGLLALPLEIAGLLALCVGIIPAMIVYYYAWAHGYEQLRAGVAPESPPADVPAPPEPPPVFVP